MIRTRIIEFIREHVMEKGEKNGSTFKVEHFLTHKDIADLIGTTRQTVSTLLNELRNEGKIDFSRLEIWSKNIRLLKDCSLPPPWG
jgi:CRP/FNR family cyclic AMP-dependent transcriptional regulator